MAYDPSKTRLGSHVHYALDPLDNDGESTERKLTMTLVVPTYGTAVQALDTATRIMDIVEGKLHREVFMAIDSVAPSQPVSGLTPGGSCRDNGSEAPSD